MEIKGFIFDMDGTMVDNMMVHHRAWQRKLAALALEMTLAEVKASVHGVNEEIIERLFGDRFSPQERHRIAYEKEAEYRQIFLPELKLLDGLHDFLQMAQAAGLTLGIATAAPAENVDFVLDELNIRHFFKTVVHAGHVTKGKPDPEVLQKAAAGMQLPLNQCVVFEDSPTGAETAYRAGCPAWIVTTTHTPDEFSHFPNVRGFLHDFSHLSIAQICEVF